MPISNSRMPPAMRKESSVMPKNSRMAVLVNRNSSINPNTVNDTNSAGRGVGHDGVTPLENDDWKAAFQR
jgi:hypothetical protein